MSVVYISHAYSSDPAGNRVRVARIARELALQGHVPLAPHLLFPSFIDEAGERDLAVKLCIELVGRADEVHTYGEVSEGMRLEVEEAERLGIPVIGETWREAQARRTRPPEP